MNIKNLKDVKDDKGRYNNIITAMLTENSLSLDDFENLFPDYNKTYYYKDILDTLPMLEHTDEFISMIQKNHGKHFCIMGDYDADGIFSTVILVSTLRYLGENCDFVIPDRLKDGYGMKNLQVDLALAKGAEILITVDNGIGCGDAANYAMSKGLQVIVTDHHLPEDGKVPQNILIIDPKYNKDKFSDICGAFVSFKLSYALLKTTKLFNYDDYFIYDMATFAAFATVTDMMPVFSENRILLKASYNYVNMMKFSNNWNGRLLKVISGLGGVYFLRDKDALASSEIYSFDIGPTVNAVSRIDGDVTFLVNNILAANKPDVFLDGYQDINNLRKNYTRILFKNHASNDNPVSIDILNQDNYQFPINGLMGLMANKIANEENKVSLVGTEIDGKYEFSCRSNPGYSIYDAFERIKNKRPDLDLNGGGHSAAMGIRIDADQTKLGDLRTELEEDYKAYSNVNEKCYYSFDDEDLDNIVKEVNAFGVFGSGFKNLPFIYTGRLESYDSTTKEAVIGNYVFKCFLKHVYIGSLKTVSFVIRTDSKKGAYFKVEDEDVK